MKAVFLDRDGVINQALVRDGKPYPPLSLDQFIILDGVKEACRQLKDAGFVLVVATNQPDVGRGLISRQIVDMMHEYMCGELPIDRVEVCFDSGSSPCDCRKPAPGMLLRAAADLQIELQRSYMIGDRWRDIDCGVSVGCSTIFIDHGYAESLRHPPDYRVASLFEAAKIILENEDRRRQVIWKT